MVEEDVSGMSDNALVVAIGRWRQAALAEVYRRHGGAVFGSARRLLGEDDGAKEMVKEVFLRLWRQPELFGQLAERHLATCPACQAEGSEPHDGAAVLLPGGTPPPDLWDSILEGLEETALPGDVDLELPGLFGHGEGTRPVERLAVAGEAEGAI